MRPPRGASVIKIMRRIKKLFSFLTMICCLAGSIAPVYAAQGVTPRAVFTNEPNTSPDLYVRKTVQSAVEGYSAPEYDRFQFVLKVNGAIAKDVKYHVLDSVHGELYRYSNNEIPFRTDQSGVFTLKAGQTAWFECTKAGDTYEVLELDTYLSPVTDDTGTIQWNYDIAYLIFREEWDGYDFIEHEPYYETKNLAEGGYECKAPTGATTGEQTMMANGCSETFSNRYTPKTDAATTTLEVIKDIAFAADYTAPETPDFTFAVKIDGNEYANEVFTVTDQDGRKIREDRTDAEGRFTLKGGQRALFAEIPADVDYRVSEVSDTVPEGWWIVGDSEKYGATQSPLTSVTFCNANTSFAVTKSMEDYSKPDVDFTFRLTDALNNAMSDKTFLYYYSNGQPIYESDSQEEQKQQMTGSTDAKGEFTLKPGQTAVFTGIRPGTSYRVREVGNAGYTQTLPLPTDDDLYTVQDNGTVKILGFVNKKTDTQGTLSVTKLVQTEEEGTLTKDTFHFILYRRLTSEDEVTTAISARTGAIEKIIQFFTSEGADKIQNALDEGWMVAVEAASPKDGDYYYEKDGKKYELYIPAQSVIYSVPQGLSNPTYFTGPRNGLSPGEFTLEADQTANFSGLNAGREYLVRELGLTEEYTEQTGKDQYVEIAYGVTHEEGVPVMAQRLLLSQDGTAFAFSNQYHPKKIDLCLTKTDDRGAVLKGAEFMLYLDRGETPADNNLYTTDKNGKVTIPDLKAGTYWLYERKAPSGYNLLKEPIKLEITRTADGLTVLVDGKNAEQIAAESQSGKVVSSLIVTPSAQADQKDTIELTIQNLYLYELPNSGGVGIYWYTIGGVLLMLAAVLILYKNKFAGGGLRD